MGKEPESPGSEIASDEGAEFVTGVATSVLHHVIGDEPKKSGGVALDDFASNDLVIQRALQREQRRQQGTILFHDRLNNLWVRLGINRSDSEILEIAGLKRD